MNAARILSARRFSDRFRHGVMAIVQAILCLALVAALFVDLQLVRLLAAVALSGLIVNVILALCAQRDILKEQQAWKAAYADAAEARTQIEELFAMTDMLQAAEGHDDAGAVLSATATRLLPTFGGALYVFNNSRDRLDLIRTWNLNGDFAPDETLLPSTCWALKRGKPHINDAATGTLCCLHTPATCATVEIPMMARGSIHGLLILAAAQSDAFERLKSIRRLGRALADSMSLALANIALREKLRTQSLRDPLTGLYNRRYVEDALDRYCSLAETSQGSVAVLMMDLDNFKSLNDNFGHAKGDAVLRDVASQLLGGLRPHDVAARYGGEELMVILPNCSPEEACQRAELLRKRIEGLSDIHGVPISASIGLASIPDTSVNPQDAVRMADEALYAAKQSGKNRVCTARVRDKQPQGDRQHRAAA